MSVIDRVYSISRVEGDVLLHHEAFGWLRAEPGMTIPECLRVTIKTSANGSAEIINADGRRVSVPGQMHQPVDGFFAYDDVDNLRFIKVTARDMMSARYLQKLEPAA